MIRPPPRWMYWLLIAWQFAAITRLDNTRALGVFFMMVATVMIAPLRK